MIGCYSPVWFDKRPSVQKAARRVTSIKFEMGERLKYCRRCDDYFPADTEFFNIARSAKVGLSPWCRACNAENQNEKRYWQRHWQKRWQ